MRKTVTTPTPSSTNGEPRTEDKNRKRQRGVPNYLGVPIREVRDRNEKHKQWTERNNNKPS